MTPRLAISDVVSRVFDLYRRQAALLLPAAAVVFLVPALVVAALRDSPSALFLVFAIALVAGFWYQGVVVTAVQDVEEDGRRDLSVGRLLAAAGPFVGPLVGAAILAGLGIVAGLILFIVPGLVLLTWWSLIAPVIVLEHAGVTRALGRSRELVRGNGWPVFAIIFLLFLVQAVVSGALRGVALAISDSALSDALGTYVGNVVVAPLTAIAATVIYRRLRAAKEGGGRFERTPAPAPEPRPQPEPAGAPALWGSPTPPSEGSPPAHDDRDDEEHHGFRPPVPGG